MNAFRKLLAQARIVRYKIWFCRDTRQVKQNATTTHTNGSVTTHKGNR